MFEKLSPKGKRWILNSIIVSAIMLFIIGFFVGKSEEEKKEIEKSNETKVEDTITYSDLHDTDSEGNENELSYEERKELPMHEFFDVDEPSEDPSESYVPTHEDEQVVTLENYFTPEEVSEAKSVAENFVKIYHSYNGDDPTKNVDESLKYVSENLKARLEGNYGRPSHNYYSRNFTDLHIYEPLNPKEKQMIINVRVKGEVFNSDGQKVKDEIVNYQVLLVPSENTFKVDDYYYETIDFIS